MVRRVGVILFENFTLLGMVSKTIAEGWILANKERIIKIFRQHNQVSVFTDQVKLNERQSNNFQEITTDELLEYLHSKESARLYKG